jgi:hypothetical protein
MPRIWEQFGLLAVVPTPRDAGGTVSVCVATRARFALAVSRALLAALGVFGTTVCCGIAFGAGVTFDAGVGADGLAEGVAVGVGVDGAGEVLG